MNNNKGFTTIEMIMNMTVIISIIIVVIGLFVYITPKIMLYVHANSLSKEVKVCGGLTAEARTRYTNALSSLGYRDIVISVSPNQADNVPPLGQAGVNYVHRYSGGLITITIETKANTYINHILPLLGLNSNLSDKYIVTNVVMSERW